MILCVCPNPSIDFTVELEQLNVGRLNRVQNKVVTYSGKALNAAIGVTRIGGESIATGFMYENDGELFVQNLNKEKVGDYFVWNPGSVRVNYKIIDNRSMLTEINDIGDNITIEKQNELIEKVKELSNRASVVILSGSLPKGVSDDYYSKLLEVIPKNVKTIVDTEGEKLVKAIEMGAYLVKPNLYELECIVEKKLSSIEEYIEGAKLLVKKGAKNVLLSLGREGALLTNGEKVLFCRSASVAVNSTVGAGDSMVAAASVMIERNEGLEEILRSAVAAGTASITTPGTNLFYRDKYEEIYYKLEVKEM